MVSSWTPIPPFAPDLLKFQSRRERNAGPAFLVSDAFGVIDPVLPTTSDASVSQRLAGWDRFAAAVDTK
jgi:hypothetical protein